MKKILKKILIFAIMFPCLILFSGCFNNGLSTSKNDATNKPQNNEHKQLGVFKEPENEDEIDNEEDKEDEEIVVSLSPFDSWKADIESGNSEISYSDWIKENYNLEFDLEKNIVSKNILSVARVKVFSSLKNARFNNNPIRAGSAVHYLNDESGDVYFVTNYHVCYKNLGSEYGYYRLEFYGTTSARYLIAEFVAGSATYDLAVIKVSKDEIQEKTWFKEMGSEPVSLKTETSDVGTSVFSIGNTRGEGLNITHGFVDEDIKAVEFNVAEKVLYHWVIQHDSFITFGNSGGGLFDYDGKLIGITNGGETNNDSVNYAIPSGVVETVANELIENNKDDETSKRIDTLVLKVENCSPKQVEQSSKLNEETGEYEIYDEFYIYRVEIDSPLYSIIKENDIYLAMYVNGEEVDIHRAYMFDMILIELEVGDVLKIEFKRENKTEPIFVEIELVEEMFEIVN